MHMNDETSSDSVGIANLFASYFSPYQSVGSVDRIDDNVNIEIPYNSVLSTMHTTALGIVEVINKINENKRGGPDEIPNFFVKKCAFELSKPLEIIFNKSLALGECPEDWKVLSIIPIYKKNDRSDVQNFGSVCKSNVFIRILEKIVYQRLYSQVKDFISYEQHGFVAGRSTMTNLLMYTNDLATAIDDGYESMDFNKCSCGK